MSEGDHRHCTKNCSESTPPRYIGRKNPQSTKEEIVQLIKSKWPDLDITHKINRCLLRMCSKNQIIFDKDYKYDINRGLFYIYTNIC